jgi:hypothetical protein
MYTSGSRNAGYVKPSRYTMWRAFNSVENVEL